MVDEVMDKEQYIDFKVPDYTSDGVGTDRSHGLGDARLFSIFIDGRVLDSLTKKEKAFYDHIQSNPNVYDITYSIANDGGIKTHIGVVWQSGRKLDINVLNLNNIFVNQKVE